MSSLLASCVEFFNTENLYQILGVTKEATAQEGKEFRSRDVPRRSCHCKGIQMMRADARIIVIHGGCFAVARIQRHRDMKRGYHKKSLLCHPDRVNADQKETATKKFQVLAKVHSILSDDGKRAEYDETGCVDDEMVVDQDRDWEQYWRLLFPKVTPKDIEEFSTKYKGSDEELSDLMNVYLASEGDMDGIMDQMMCSSHEDEPRFYKMLQTLIDNGRVPAFEAFTKESKKKKNARSKKAQSEAKEAEEEAKKLKLGQGEDSLAAFIASRQASRAQQADDFISQLEAKYGGAGKKKTSRNAKK